MNRSISKSLLPALLSLLFYAVPASGVGMLDDSLSISNSREIKHAIRWEHLTPRYTKLQIAGGMGIASFGFGWDYGKNRQWETDLLIGYIPEFSSDRSSFTFTLKQNFIPWKIPLSNSFSFEPLETGLYMNKVFSDSFWAVEPERYNGPYYKFATSIRFSVFLGQRINLHINRQDPIWKSISFFYEVSTNDLYLVSYAGNTKALNLGDILVLSFGLKFQIL